MNEVQGDQEQGDEQLVLDLARGGLGVNYWIIGHVHHGWLGILKDSIAMRDAALDVPPGPLADEILAAARIMAGQGRDIGELHWRGTAKNLAAVKEDGRQILVAFAPTLVGLPDDAAGQVREWLLAIAERIAGAARDRFRGAKVTEEERQALAELRRFLADPDGAPLTTP